MFIGVNVQQNQGWAALARWGFYPEASYYGPKPYGLITSAFVHVEPLHLLFNLYWLWILGGALERTLGSARWLVFVLIAAWISSGLQLLSGNGGIGLSGVGYALFGFGWVTRRRYPEFARVMQDRTVQVFIIWGVICVIGTYIGAMRIGNFAHAGGLAVGAAIGALLTVPRMKIVAGAALLVLTAASVLPLFWNPLSLDWLEYKADSAMESHRYAEAEEYFHRALDGGSNPEWAWHNLAEIYGYRGNTDAYKAALDQLEQVDGDAAQEVKERYGDPRTREE